MAMSAYEIIKRSSPSLAKHFKETEEMINEISKEIDKVKPISDLCYFGENTTTVEDYGFDYLIIAEHVNGKPTGNGVIVTIDSPGFIGGTSWIVARRGHSTKPQIIIEYSDDYKYSQSIFYLLKWSDTDNYLVDMLKTVVGLAEKTSDENENNTIDLGDIDVGNPTVVSITNDMLLNSPTFIKFRILAGNSKYTYFTPLAQVCENRKTGTIESAYAKTITNDFEITMSLNDNSSYEFTVENVLE